MTAVLLVCPLCFHSHPTPIWLLSYPWKDVSTGWAAVGEILKTEFLVPLETCFSQLHMIHSHISHIRACSFFYSESPKFPPAPAPPGYSSLLPDLISRTATASPNHHFILVPSTSIFRYHPIRLFSPPLPKTSLSWIVLAKQDLLFRLSFCA